MTTNAVQQPAMAFPVHEDPYETGHLIDPYPLYGRIREAGPLIRLQKYDWLACGRDQEVRQVLTDHATWISGAGVGPKNFHQETNWRTPGVLESDGDRHTSLRGALDAVISPRSVRGMRTGFITFANILVERLLDQRQFDGITDLAEAY